MIKYLTEAEKQDSRELWEEAFPEDSRAFDDYYYKEKVEKNRILALVEEPGQIQAMIQMNPYLVQAGGFRWTVDYLVGVATRKEKRHRGYMRRLLQQMMEDMRAASMPFCFLMPAAEAIYRPFGFTYIFDQPRWKLRPSAENRLRRKEASSMAAEAAGWMTDWLQNRYQVFAVRDEAYVKILLAELASEDGVLEALYDGERLSGFQADWGWNKKEQRLLYADAFYIEETAEPKPTIMARIITPEECVKPICLKEGELEELKVNLWLEDPLLPQNQGLWLWHLNHETSWLERAEIPVSGGASAKLTITELTSWLFGYSVPETVRELDEKIETLQGVFLDEVV